MLRDQAFERLEEPDTGIYDAFVSYSRKDIEFAKLLKRFLEENGRRVWIDLEGIQPTTEWLQEILRAIERSRAFLFLISPDSVLSRFANIEISHAVNHGKHIVPILYRPIEDHQAPEEIGKRHWVDAQPAREFLEVGKHILEALSLDLAWVDFHTRLTIRVAEWKTRGFSKDLLLRGRELCAALQQLSSQSDREPGLRKIHHDFINTSRGAARNRQIWSTLLGFGIFCGMVVLGLFGLDRLMKEVAQRRSVVGLNAIERPGASNGFSDRGLVLAAGGYLLRDTPVTRSVLLNALQRYPRLFSHLHGHTAATLTVGFVRTSGQAITVDISGHFSIWDLTRPEVPSQTGYIASPKGEWSRAQLDDAGTRLALGDQAGNIALCDLNVVTPCWVDKATSSGVTSLSFNPRTGQLASGHRDGTIAFFSVSHPLSKPELHKEVHSKPVHALAFDPQGYLLASGEESGHIYMWNLIDPKPMPRHVGSHPLVVWNLAFTEDGQFLASGDGGGRVYLWDIAAQTPKPLELNGSSGTILDLSIARRKLAVSDATGNLLVWDLEQKPPTLTTLRRHGKANIGRHVFAKSGGALIGLDNKGRISSWDLTTDPAGEETLGILDLPVQGIREMVAVDSDQERVIAGDSLGHFSLWHLAQLSPISKEEVLQIRNVDSAVFAESGTAAALATFSDIVYWNGHTGARQLIDEAALKIESISGLAISTDGKRLAVSGIQKGLKLVEISEERLDVHELDENSTYSPSFSPDGRFLAGTSGTDGGLYLWNLEQDKSLPKIEDLNGRRVSATGFSRDGRYLVTGESDGRIYSWKLDSFPQNSAVHLGHDAGITVLTFSLDSQVLLTADMKGKVLVRQFMGSTSEVKFSLQHQTYVTSVAIDPASKFIATADLDGHVMLWDARNGLFIGELFANLLIDGKSGNRMYSLALTFDKEGKNLFGLFRDGRRITWIIKPENWIDVACHLANRRLLEREHVENDLFFFPRPCEERRPYGSLRWSDIAEIWNKSHSAVGIPSDFGSPKSDVRR